MNRFKVVAVLIVAIFAISFIGCSQDLSTYGNLKAKVVDSDTVEISYSFAKVPKAVDNGQVYLNGEIVGSGSGKGVKRFDNVEPNSVFKLTTATQTLATVITHAK
jgi:hypothetical protein